MLISRQPSGRASFSSDSVHVHMSSLATCHNWPQWYSTAPSPHATTGRSGTPLLPCHMLQLASVVLYCSLATCHNWLQWYSTAPSPYATTGLSGTPLLPRHMPQLAAVVLHALLSRHMPKLAAMLLHCSLATCPNWPQWYSTAPSSHATTGRSGTLLLSRHMPQLAAVVLHCVAHATWHSH